MLPGTGRRRAAENRVGNPSRLACRKGGHQEDNRQQALARARPGGLTRRGRRGNRRGGASES